MHWARDVIRDPKMTSLLGAGSRGNAMGLSTKELSNLINLLAEDNLKTYNLEALLSSYHRYFGKLDNFRVGSALVILLQMKDLLPSPSQRIAAIFLLHELYRSDTTSANPFVSFFAELLQPSVEDDRAQMNLPCGHDLSPVEQWFLAQLLAPTLQRELYKKTPAGIASTDMSTVQTPNISSLVASLQDSNGDLLAHCKVGIPCTISDPDPSTMLRPDPASAGQVAETILCGTEGMTVSPFEPTFIRPLPPLHSGSTELTWLNPTESQYNIQWDDQMCPGGSKKLFAKAYKEALIPQEQEQLIAEFKSDVKLVYHVGLTPQKLPQLVEKNPTVAIEALLNLTTSPQFSEYLAALVNMDMSLHSMEVVNRLTTAVDLPREFLLLYITNCIQRCRENADKATQSRQVRLVCVFLQSLIRNRIINVQEDVVEIQQFALEFSKIKDASALYRLLKTLQESGSEGQSK